MRELKSPRWDLSGVDTAIDAIVFDVWLMRLSTVGFSSMSSNKFCRRTSEKRARERIESFDTLYELQETLAKDSWKIELVFG